MYEEIKDLFKFSVASPFTIDNQNPHNLTNITQRNHTLTKRTDVKHKITVTDFRKTLSHIEKTNNHPLA